MSSTETESYAEPSPMAMSSFGVAVMGRFREGIVAEISSCLLSLRCNIEEAVSSVLCGNFALVLVCEAPVGTSRRQVHARLRQVLGDLPGNAQTAIHVDVWEVDDSLEQPEANYTLMVYGPDQLGVIDRVAGFLVGSGVRISDMVALKRHVNSSGSACILTFELDVPKSVHVHTLEDGLSRACTDLLDVELMLRPIE